METKTEVRCKHCDTILVQIQDFRKAMNDCQHFTWEEVSTLCFHEYFEHPECDADYVWRLRRRYVMRIDDGERYFLLVPAGEAEEQ
jgi:hypothetical protein